WHRSGLAGGSLTLLLHRVEILLQVDVVGRGKALDLGIRFLVIVDDRVSIVFDCAVGALLLREIRQRDLALVRPVQHSQNCPRVRTFVGRGSRGSVRRRWSTRWWSTRRWSTRRTRSSLSERWQG